MEPPAFFDDQERRFRGLPDDHDAKRDLSAVVASGVWTITYGPEDTAAFRDEFRDIAAQAAIGAEVIAGD